MAKLTDRQKNNIIAKWNTGSYTKTQLAKSYKVNEKIIRNLVGKEEPKNADIVKAHVELEKFKKSEKSPIEIKAINQAVTYELDSIEYKNRNVENIHNITNHILTGLNGLLEKGKAQKVVTESTGPGFSQAAVIETDLQAVDYKNAQDAVFKAGQTFGVVDSGKSVEVNNTNAVQNNIEDNEITISIKE